MSHIIATAKWLGSTMAYLIIMAYIDGTIGNGGLRKSSFWIFLNTFAKGFSLTFEQFYFEVVFPLLFIALTWWWANVWGSEK